MGLSRSDAVLVFCCLEGGECDLGIGEVVQGAENGCHARRIGLRRRRALGSGVGARASLII